jgi:Domain of unknown function (DUF4252)
MNKFMSSFMLALVAAYPLAGFGQTSLEKEPAYLPIDKVLDLKTIRPEVNINLPHFLLKDAVSELNGASPVDGIDIADLIKDVKLIRVVVIEANKTNREALDKAVKTLRADLEKSWTPIVSVPENNVGVYAMGDPAGESTTGLAVLVYDGGDAVIGNVVGHVSIGKLIKIASQTGKVPKDFLKKLQGIGNQTNQQPATKPGDSAGTNAAGATPKTPAEDAAPK